jgi:hypothetical protein
VLNFCANNYLGLAGHPAIVANVSHASRTHLHMSIEVKAMISETEHTKDQAAGYAIDGDEASAPYHSRGRHSTCIASAAVVHVGRNDRGSSAYRPGAGPSVPYRGPEPWILSLSAAERSLLERLRRGITISAAATEGYLSLRTANRRLADLRRRAGVATTRKLVMEYEALRFHLEHPSGVDLVTFVGSADASVIVFSSAAPTDGPTLEPSLPWHAGRQ